MPDDEVILSAEAAAVANRIRSIDADLADLERRTEALVGQGLKGGFDFGLPQRAEEAMDARRDDLLGRRAALVEQLKTLTGLT